MIKLTDEIRDNFKELMEIMREANAETVIQKFSYIDKRYPKYEMEIQLILKELEEEE